MRNVARLIDSVSQWVGSAVRWLVIALTVVVVYGVIARYVFNAPTTWGFELSCMLGASIICLGWAYVQQSESNVRVDVFYTRVSSRKKALIDVLGAAVLFFPLFVIFIKTSISWMWIAWQTGEIISRTLWYPPAGPIRTIVVVGACLLSLQVITQFIHDLHMLIKGKPL